MDKPIRLGVVQDSPEFVTPEEFPELARTDWAEAKDAYRAAHRRMSSLLDLLHKPGTARVAGQATGALYEAKQIRDEADRMVVALDHLVTTARSCRENR